MMTSDGDCKSDLHLCKSEIRTTDDGVCKSDLVIRLKGSGDGYPGSGCVTFRGHVCKSELLTTY